MLDGRSTCLRKRLTYLPSVQKPPSANKTQQRMPMKVQHLAIDYFNSKYEIIVKDIFVHFQFP